MTLIEIVIAALEELKGREITNLAVSKLTSLTDNMIICTGTSSRHVQALADNVVMAAKAQHYSALGVEGKDQGEWVLIDLDEVIVHVMLQPTRDFYSLEKLWQTPVARREQSING